MFGDVTEMISDVTGASGNVTNAKSDVTDMLRNATNAGKNVADMFGIAAKPLSNVVKTAGNAAGIPGCAEKVLATMAADHPLQPIRPGTTDENADI